MNARQNFYFGSQLTNIGETTPIDSHLFSQNALAHNMASNRTVCLDYLILTVLVWLAFTGKGINHFLVVLIRSCFALLFVSNRKDLSQTSFRVVLDGVESILFESHEPWDLHRCFCRTIGKVRLSVTQDL